MKPDVQITEKKETTLESKDRLSAISGAGWYHAPVLREEVGRVLQPDCASLFVDGTLGGGGHTRALLEAGASVIALDQDMDAIEHAKKSLPDFGERLTLVHGNFRKLREILNQQAVEMVDGILLDLGVSSWQLDRPERGFSFQKEGPLDMRMRQGDGATAADLVNTLSAEDLAAILKKFGEEPNAKRIAKVLVEKRPFYTTLELADAVAKVIPKTGRRHPATRVFQALRLAVNEELDSLKEVLESAPGCLRSGGRLAVITFHSLEDRIVKHFFRETTCAELDRPEWPAPRKNPRHFFNPIKGTPLVPSDEEVAANPRARSARLRAVERN